MRAAVYRSDGVLGVEEVETPVPGPGEVRVRVTVSGVNPTDWKARAAAAEFQVPNQDGAGVSTSSTASTPSAR
jgi:NADPH2:quinone reductase